MKRNDLLATGCRFPLPLHRARWQAQGMKRQWRIGRIILAVMLVGFTALIFAYWPKTPQWSIPLATVLGFDEGKNLLYSISYRDNHYELRGYELSTAAPQVSVALHPVTLDDPSRAATGTTHEQRLNNYSAAWNWVLSPNKQTLFAFNYDQDNFQAFDLQSGHRIEAFDYPPNVSLIELKIGFSRDGSLLAIQDRTEAVHVWDLHTGHYKQHQKLRHLGLGIWPATVVFNEVSIDSQSGVLAYRYNHRETIVKDMRTNKEVFHESDVGIPTIRADGNMVIFTPESVAEDKRPSWYHRLKDGGFEKLVLDLMDKGDIGEFVCYSNDLLVTDTAERVEFNFMKWLPAGLRNWAVRHLPLQGERNRLRFWDLNNGLLRQECSIFENSSLDQGPIRKRLTISESGRWLAQSFDNKISVWEVTTQRPLLCWLIVLSLVVSAAWLAWPRRVKVA